MAERRATAVIAAAGSGERLGAGGPKALVPVAGRPLIAWALEAFAGADRVDGVIVAAPPGREEDLTEAARAGGFADLRCVAGGASRSESVRNALAAVDAELVVIHDAARPLVTAGLIDAVLDALAADPAAAGAIAAAPVTDTVKQADGEPPAVSSTLDRSRLWAAQTPQAFRVAQLRDALDAASPAELAAATDDASLVERGGGRVLICPAPPENLKVTTALDLRLAEALLAERRAG